MIEAPPLPTEVPVRFFQKVDWLAFGVAFGVMFSIYLLTLAPSVTAGNSDNYVVNAMFPGPAISPGHPLWAAYGWLFIHLVPFSDIAWRVNVASATAAALLCGLLSMLVSRIAVAGLPGFKKIPSREQNWVRFVCGGVAGLGLGLDAAIWSHAVRADALTLDLLLFGITLCLLTRWFFRPARKVSLHLSFFMGGLTLAENAALTPAVLCLGILLVLGDLHLGRDGLLFTSVLLWGLLLTNQFIPMIFDFQNLLFVTALGTTLVGGFLCWRTRTVLSEWKVVGFGATLFLLGLASYLLLPVYSMTNPPANVGYQRIAEGFFRLSRRGCYCSCNQVFLAPAELAGALWVYFKMALPDLGGCYVCAAVIPVFFLRKASPILRRWLIGLLTGWLGSTILMLSLLRSGLTETTLKTTAPYLAVSYFTLALLAGLGMILIAIYFCGQTSTPPTILPFERSAAADFPPANPNE